MAGAVRSKATLADFLAIPEETRFHELIDGSSSSDHGRRSITAPPKPPWVASFTQGRTGGS
jgi:hypothetical protein